MSISDGRNKSASTNAVDPAWDGRAGSGDGRFREVTSGGWRGTSGKLLARYGWVALLIVATAAVNVLTASQHDGGFAGLRGPILDESTSAVVLIGLLPLLKRSLDAFAKARDRRIAVIVVALAMVIYALLHVTCMVLLRQGAYAALGGAYDFNWRGQFVPELRKDIISAFMIVVVFWLIDRRAIAARAPAAIVSDAKRSDIWLKDGTTSIRVDPADIITVTSAGNYVEFALAGQHHLIRGTLAAEEARLKPFGFSRVHRTRLVNTERIVAIEQRPNGDFVLRMDTGDTIAGSRRYRDGIAAIKGTELAGK
jgi:hypothetical protein